MWTIAFKFVAGFFGGGKNPLFWIALVVAIVIGYFTFAPMLSTIGGWLGWETKASLKAENTQLKKNEVVLVDANKSKDTVIAVQDGTLENTQKSFDDRRANETKTRQTVTKILKDRDTAIEKIEAEPIDPVVKHQQISLEHINAIWGTFCTFNDNPECANVPQLKEAA